MRTAHEIIERRCQAERKLKAAIDSVNAPALAFLRDPNNRVAVESYLNACARSIYDVTGHRVRMFAFGLRSRRGPFTDDMRTMLDDIERAEQELRGGR